ncbi:MAG: c-type cytochrome [Burkholderiaceae bacterium]|nr:c-type cytochrome [Burkholderiaceae bacterium]
MAPTAEVVVQCTQHRSDVDLNAIATYLQSLPPVRPCAVVPSNAALPERGERLYTERCADCHGDRGEGVPGTYPPLAGNPSALQPNPTNRVQAVRRGGFAPATQAHARPTACRRPISTMPRWPIC